MALISTAHAHRTSAILSAMIALSGALALSAPAAWSQGRLQPFAVDGTAKLYQVKPALRVGSRAALARLVRWVDGSTFMTTHQVLMACDGSWISPALNSSYEQDTTDVVKAEAQAAQKDDAVPLDPLRFIPLSESQLFFAKALASRAATVCKGAVSEPRNLLLPVSQFLNSANSKGSALSIISGTARRNGAWIELWVRASDFKVEPIKNADGTDMVLMGVTPTRNVASGPFSLNRMAIECHDRRMRIFRTMEYENANDESKRDHQWRDPVTIEVAPGTTGESLLEAVCRLY